MNFQIIWTIATDLKVGQHLAHWGSWDEILYIYDLGNRLGIKYFNELLQKEDTLTCKRTDEYNVLESYSEEYKKEFWAFFGKEYK